ncbi:MAG: hypothetical protein HY343_10970 [Lentisphaerae bacterium]|nr:hypothetical protein [Lentisphaerota bacterium]
MKTTLLRAGAAAADITPSKGTQIAGNIGVKRPAEIFESPLQARALILEGGEQRLCVLTTDVLAIRDDYAAEVRRRAQARFGLDPAKLLVNCTQNHLAPSVGHCFCLDEAFWRRYVPDELEWVLGGDRAYNEHFLDGCMRAIEGALATVRPVTARVGRCIEGRIGFNRRAILRDGTAVMHPAAGDPNILQVEGPMDPEVSLLTLRDEAGRCVSALMHFSCHPCHSAGQLTIAHAWPGAWCEGMSPVLGEGAVPLVVNGCCGNLHPRNPLAPELTLNYRAMGRILTDDGRAILEKQEDAAGLPLDVRRKILRIPLRELDPALIEEAKSLLEQHPTPMWLDAGHTRINWDWIYAISRVDLAQHRARQPWYDYEVQAFRIGDVALVALTGEPFSEGQLDLKLRSPARYTMVAHMSNGYVGYVPTPAAIARGGFETRTAHWSKLVPEALQTIMDTGVGLLKEMF